MADPARIAAEIRDVVERHQRSYGDRWPLHGCDVVRAVVDALQMDDPQFDRAGFLNDCGMEETFTLKLID